MGSSEEAKDGTIVKAGQEESTEENQDKKKGKTESGLDENLAGLLCYVFIGAIIFLFIEKENRFIRFHAIQALLTGIVMFVFSIVLTAIPLLGLLLSILLTPVYLVFWIFLMYKAYQGEYFKVPVIGEIAQKQVDQMSA